MGLREISELDELFFKSNRFDFLKNLYEDSLKSSCLSLKDQGKIVGFIMIRRRLFSKAEGHFNEGPDYAYRLGPVCLIPKYGINGFKALFQEAIKAVNQEVCQFSANAKIYVVFPRNAEKNDIYQDTLNLAKAMAMNTAINLDKVFDEHEHIFKTQNSMKNEEQWKYLQGLGFQQEYFEQVMSLSPDEDRRTPFNQRTTESTRSEPEGIFALASPGDKS